MKRRMGFILCISALVMSAAGCGSHGDTTDEYTIDEYIADGYTIDEYMTDGYAVDTYVTDEYMADAETRPDNAKAEGQIGLSRGEFCDRVQKKYDISERYARAMYQKIEDSKILEEESVYLTGVALGDYDQNGQTDMIVCLYEDKVKDDGCTDGCLYLFMNDDEPYYIHDDFCYYYFGAIFGDFGADIDHDGNTEIVFCVQGIGVGGAGDCQKFVLKYKDKEIERMELPSDFSEEYGDDSGLQIKIEKDAGKGVYNIYCPYFDETVAFDTEDEEDWGGGANCRGYYMLDMAYYQGEEFLTGYEYLYDGYIANGLAVAVFVFDWDENGTAYVKDWYVADWDVDGVKKIYVPSWARERGLYWDADGVKKVYVPSPKLPESLFDEKETGQEVRAYEEFLAGKLAANMDENIYTDSIYIFGEDTKFAEPEVMDKDGEGFYIEKLINEITSEAIQYNDMSTVGSPQYALIDCGSDGKKQLALRMDFDLRIDGGNFTMVFDYKEGKVVMTYAAGSWARGGSELYKNGYVFGDGSGGASTHYEWEGVIGADGVYHESFNRHTEFGDTVYGMGMSSLWEVWDINQHGSTYPMNFREYHIEEETVYSYEIRGKADITAEERQIILDYIKDNEELLDLDILTDDKAWELVEKNRKRLGITDEMRMEENKIEWKNVNVIARRQKADLG